MPKHMGITRRALSFLLSHLRVKDVENNSVVFALLRPDFVFAGYSTTAEQKRKA